MTTTRATTTSLFLCCVLLLLDNAAEALALGVSNQARSRLSEAFSSPSGKLTFSPEIILPNPSDPTAILLQANAVKNLSERVRHGKANAAFLTGSVMALQLFTTEQETALGKFPGPVPVVYCKPLSSGSEEDDDGAMTMSAIAEAGALGILIPVCDGSELSVVDEVSSSTGSQWISQCKEAWQCGLEPIPEVTLRQDTATTWSEEQTEALVEKLKEVLGIEPVSLVLTVNPPPETSSDDEKEEDSVVADKVIAKKPEEEEMLPLPKVPKALGKRVAILGSVRTKAGKNRLGVDTARYKDAGFAGCFLQSDCLPGYRIQLDLDIVGQFWSACITDLKSVKSKSFNFRSKNNMEMDLATKWANYRQRVLDDGAMGDMSEQIPIDTDAGDYQGF